MAETGTNTIALTGGQTTAVKIFGWLGVVGGALLIIVGIVAWIAVSNQLRAENIIVPDDAMAFQGQQVAGPLTAFVQADIINTHSLEASGGATYAELDQEDPVRAVMMNASFLRASLFTSVVSFGVALFAAGVGVMFLLYGIALLMLAPSRRTAAA
ncbi:aromatic ring-opening dioxygenase LigA [Agromyces mangrovi Wang et al. 2018]|uniref:aromatic ring-opening dioxygenase LigA n=1 Tax=Agromyces mangrovi TaxID=1858653 RepID=UPI0025734617|nr:aromatic ring-opening dioxygenase LigA [Agromyces mangrovi]BDZ64471.1 hypothetical protein GCM10025877_14090 [Agromyces mangrovi]